MTIISAPARADTDAVHRAGVPVRVPARPARAVRDHASRAAECPADGREPAVLHARRVAISPVHDRVDRGQLRLRAVDRVDPDLRGAGRRAGSWTTYDAVSATRIRSSLFEID